MRGHLELLRRLQQEPSREFTTSRLVEALYPVEWRRIRHSQEFGAKRDQRIAQAEKTRLHRKALYHIGQLVKQGLLAVVRLDAHGEKVYRVAGSGGSVGSAIGPITIEPRELSIPHLAQAIDDGSVALFERTSALARYDSLYLHAEHLDGLGQLLQLTESALRATSDTLAIGGTGALLSRYHLDDLREFVHSLILQTLDEGKTISLVLSLAQPGDRQLMHAVAEAQPARILLTVQAPPASLRDPLSHEILGVLQEKLGKITISPHGPEHPPAYTGRAGPYEVSKESWAQITTQETPLVVVCRCSIAIDLPRTNSMRASEYETFAREVGSGVFAIAAQQQLAATGASALSAILPTPAVALRHASVAVRVWNYDWSNPPQSLPLTRDAVREALRANAHVYRACGLPLEPTLLLSTAFTRFSDSLSARVYRKWSITRESDLHTAAFAEYRNARSHVASMLGGVDRLRIFRTSNPTSAQVAAELAWLGTLGFALVTYEFKALQGLRKLTEFLEASP